MKLSACFTPIIQDIAVVGHALVDGVEWLKRLIRVLPTSDGQ